MAYSRVKKLNRQLMSLVEVIACRTIGCTSFFARWFTWPHGKICNPLAIHNYELERKGRNES